MIVFAATEWLWTATAAAAVGGWALWRGQRRQRAVSSLKLWRGLDQASGATRARAIDPLWALVLLAGILAAVALAGPQWQNGANQAAASPHVSWAVRSILHPPPGEKPRAEAWIQVPDAGPDIDTLRVQGVARSVSPAELRTGIAVEISASPAKLTLEDGGRILADATFDPPPADARPFGLLHLTGAGILDPALDRIFAMQPGVHLDDPATEPSVLLVRGMKPAPEQLAGVNLVIAEPDAELPGVTLASRQVAPGTLADGWVPEVVQDNQFGWPSFVILKNVHVKALREVQLSPEWEVVARADGKPWIAIRKDHGLWIWLASEPSTDTDWPRSGADFVAFFGEMQFRAFGSAGEQTLTNWIRQPAALSQNIPSIALASYTGIAAMLLLTIAAVWHVSRHGMRLSKRGRAAA